MSPEGSEAEASLLARELSVNGQACLEVDFVVKNQMGLHVRPATKLATHAAKFSDTEIWLIKGESQVDAKTPLLILTVAGVVGTEYSLRASGPQAREALTELSALANRKFDVDS